jgi:DNA polymerase-3 subunit alpha
MSNKFVHLHVHTEYSLLDGMSRMKNLFSWVKKNGMDSVAITDHGVMYGVVEFYKEAKNQEIKPILGMEAYTTVGDHTKKQERATFKNNHLLLLAKNNEGYKNLMKITTIAHLEGYYYRPRISRELLKKYHEGLICTSACPQGEVAQALIDGNKKKAKKIVEWFLDVFGDDYYLEMQRHEYAQFVKSAKEAQIKKELRQMAENEKLINKGVVEISRNLGVPLVATNDAHYVEKKDASAQDALVCIATGKKINDIKRMRFIDTPTYYVRPPKEMIALFKDYPDAIENTVKIAEKCDVEIKMGDWYFPKITLPKGLTADKYLLSRATDELKKKIKNPTKEYKDRLEYELKVICDKGYAPYFIIYMDMADWANKRNVPINIRGSVAGSLVTYVLGITTVDPIVYGLPFERFLNPMRPSAPDIDMDIADDRREDMIRYLTKKYGKEKVAQICTFGRMLARGSVRDVARVLGFEYSKGDSIAKAIPLGSQGFPMTIDKALSESNDLESMYKNDKDSKNILDLARQIEGSARHISVHAAGVVVAPEKLINFTPLQKEPSGEKIITQYEMHACEDIGLVKLDILGIRNLAILREAVELVKQTTGKSVDLAKIPLDDKKTFEMLSRGETMGTFQLSGSGMTKYLVELKPERIDDIMAMIALYRPGPMANIKEYIDRKKGKKPITYYHPKMKKFLEKSYGILVYQDDLLFTALDLAGYDWKEVDKFRKAVGKKIPAEMARQHTRFVEGCVNNADMTKDEAEGLWDLFEPFQGYGFNKAHAASYGMVAYQTAYMKANYPVEYMAALLTAESNDKDKVSSAISECRRIKIPILPPDINRSDVGFKIVDDEKSSYGVAIRFGLSAIKNVGNAAIEAILSARQDGEFMSFADFLSRVDGRKVNKKVLESLIKVGAMSNFGKRASLLASMDEIRSKVGAINKNSNQQGLFSSDEIKKSMQNPKIQIENVDEFNDDELQNLERQLLGFSLSAKPIDDIIRSLSPLATHKINELIHSDRAEENVKIAAIVAEVRIIITKKSGQEMAFVKVKDDTGLIELVVFPKIFQTTRSTWVDNKPLLISGRIDLRDEEPSIIVNQIETKKDVKESKDRLFIRIPKGVTPNNLSLLKDVLVSSPGNQKVTLLFEGNNERKVNLRFKINWSDSLALRITKALSPEADYDVS